MSNEFDNVAGMLLYLTTGLQGLNELARERKEYGYSADHKCGLHSFLILGHWGTDSCGNFGPARLLDEHYKPIAVPKNLPPIIPYEDITKYGIHAISVSSRASLPPVHVRCRLCRKKWQLENAHDVHVTDSHVVCPIPPAWIGRTLQQFDQNLRERDTGFHFLGSNPTIRNRKYEAPKAEREFERRGHRDVSLDHVIEDNDSTFMYQFEFWHRNCWKMHSYNQNRQQFERIFRAAGFGSFYLRDIPNGYWPATEEYTAERTPWFEAITEHGCFTIGWRKHVISIEWSDIGIDLQYLFHEDQTKEPTLVHAYGQDQAIGFLRRIRSALEEN